MQFHGTGFRSGDPEMQPQSEKGLRRALASTPPKEVDVLIVGCGPTGLTLGAQLAAFPELEVCIVDREPGPLELGRADGIACRSVEMFHAFGFAERVLREAYWVNEASFWRTGEDASQGIFRSGRIDDTETGLSEFPHVILNQARVHEFYMDIMRKAPNRITPWHGRRLVDLCIDLARSHPITARLEVTEGDAAARIETITARYAVGCDGARSTVRSSLGLALEGDSANQAWGVMDVLAVTDFPDIRLKAVITSALGGTLVLIPREGGYLVRIYVEMETLNTGERVAARNLTVEDIIASTRRVFSPYTFEVKEVAWWSVYEIGQRICRRYDDVPNEEMETRLPRVFIAGDACHTHSPKAGQGMNVSMQDAFNLGWKLGAVLTGQCAPTILRTYSAERHALAKELIDFDRKWAALLSAASKKAAAIAVDPAEVQSYFIRHGHYTAGTATRYAPSLLTGSDDHQSLAKGFVVGKRFHSAPVVRLADALPMQLGHVIKADGRWRLFAFAPDTDLAASLAQLQRLSDSLLQNPRSPLIKLTRRDADIDSVIDVRCVLPFHHRDVEWAALPGLWRPAKGPLGLIDYEKAFCADRNTGRDIYELRGIDRQKGCLILVRPDQYVSQVLPLEAELRLAEFFERFCIRRSTGEPNVD